MGWLTLPNIGIAAGIIAGVVGIVLGIDNRLARARDRKRGLEGVYLLIYLEIEHNLERLQRLWSEVSDEPPGPSESDRVADQRAFSLANAETLHWTMLMWEAHVTRVNDALRERQITDVLNFYWHLERLTYLHSDVIRANAIALRATPGPFEYGPITSSGSLQDRQAMRQIMEAHAEAVAALTTRMEKYREFEALALDVLERDNPLPAPSSERNRQRRRRLSILRASDAATAMAHSAIARVRAVGRRRLP